MRIRDAVDDASKARKEKSVADTKTAEEQAKDNIQVLEPDGTNTATYFSSGPTPLSVTDSGVWRRVRFGLLAEKVRLQFSGGPLEVAFEDPSDSPRSVIPLTAAESPFEMGGHVALDSGFIWFKLPEGTAGPVNLKILAYK